MRFRVVAASIAVTAAAAACGIFTEERICTLIGCDSGLSIEIESLPPMPVLLSVRLPDGSVLEQECLPQLCVLGTFFGDVAAMTVEISVTMDGYTETFTQELTYQRHQPNGDDCPPVCLVALVRLKALPGPALPA